MAQAATDEAASPSGRERSSSPLFLYAQTQRVQDATSSSAAPNQQANDIKPLSPPQEAHSSPPLRSAPQATLGQLVAAAATATPDGAVSAETGPSAAATAAGLAEAPPLAGPAAAAASPFVQRPTKLLDFIASTTEQSLSMFHQGIVRQYHHFQSQIDRTAFLQAAIKTADQLGQRCLPAAKAVLEALLAEHTRLVANSAAQQQQQRPSLERQQSALKSVNAELAMVHHQHEQYTKELQKLQTDQFNHQLALQEAQRQSPVVDARQQALIDRLAGFQNDIGAVQAKRSANGQRNDELLRHLQTFKAQMTATQGTDAAAGQQFSPVASTGQIPADAHGAMPPPPARVASGSRPAPIAIPPAGSASAAQSPGLGTPNHQQQPGSATFAGAGASPGLPNGAAPRIHSGSQRPSSAGMGPAQVQQQQQKQQRPRVPSASSTPLGLAFDAQAFDTMRWPLAPASTSPRGLPARPEHPQGNPASPQHQRSASMQSSPQQAHTQQQQQQQIQQTQAQAQQAQAYLQQQVAQQAEARKQASQQASLQAHRVAESVQAQNRQLTFAQVQAQQKNGTGRSASAQAAQPQPQPGQANQQQGAQASQPQSAAAHAQMQQQQAQAQAQAQMQAVQEQRMHQQGMLALTQQLATQVQQQQQREALQSSPSTPPIVQRPRQASEASPLAPQQQIQQQQLQRVRSSTYQGSPGSAAAGPSSAAGGAGASPLSKSPQGPNAAAEGATQASAPAGLVTVNERGPLFTSHQVAAAESAWRDHAKSDLTRSKGKEPEASDMRVRATAGIGRLVGGLHAQGKLDGTVLLQSQIAIGHTAELQRLSVQVGNLNVSNSVISETQTKHNAAMQELSQSVNRLVHLPMVLQDLQGRCVTWEKNFLGFITQGQTERRLLYLQIKASEAEVEKLAAAQEAAAASAVAAAKEVAATTAVTAAAAVVAAQTSNAPAQPGASSSALVPASPILQDGKPANSALTVQVDDVHRAIRAVSKRLAMLEKRLTQQFAADLQDLLDRPLPAPTNVLPPEVKKVLETLSGLSDRHGEAIHALQQSWAKLEHSSNSTTLAFQTVTNRLNGAEQGLSRIEDKVEHSSTAATQAVEAVTLRLDGTEETLRRVENRLKTGKEETLRLVEDKLKTDSTGVTKAVEMITAKVEDGEESLRRIESKVDAAVTADAQSAFEARMEQRLAAMREETLKREESLNRRLEALSLENKDLKNRLKTVERAGSSKPSVPVPAPVPAPRAPTPSSRAPTPSSRPTAPARPVAPAPTSSRKTQSAANGVSRTNGSMLAPRTPEGGTKRSKGPSAAPDTPAASDGDEEGVVDARRKRRRANVVVPVMTQTSPVHRRRPMHIEDAIFQDEEEEGEVDELNELESTSQRSRSSTAATGRERIEDSEDSDDLPIVNLAPQRSKSSSKPGRRK